MALLGKIVAVLLALALVAGVAGWVLSSPERLDAATLAALPAGDPARGERIFWAGGCASCHARPGAQGDARLELAGGLQLRTPFGIFVPPNISSDPQHGIGGWSTADFANAMMRGVAPDGSHYYPAFPYASYARMRIEDVADLHAFMKTLPAVAQDAPGHILAFPYNIRRGLGLWKRLYVGSEPVVAFPQGTPDAVLRGRYLVEGPGHCGECHTPRDFAGGAKKDLWLAGAPAVEGSGRVPNITGGEGGIGDWSEAEIAEFLDSGFTPDFDSAGGAMADVIENTARLSPEDREAIAAYLKAIPPHPGQSQAR